MCKVYFTEDTPAILSKAGSNSNLSVLSIDSAPARAPPTVEAHDTSDSSNLSDAGDLLEECIQKGIAKVRHQTAMAALDQKVVKNKGPQSETPSIPYRDDVYVSTSRKHESRLPVKTQRPEKPLALTLARNDSLSSLSLDSFGSTDREIFEETVKAGLSRVNKSDDRRSKAHSVERPSEFNRHNRQNKSLDRSDKTNQRSKVSDHEFERSSSGVNVRTKKRLEEVSSRSYAFPTDLSRLSRSRYTDDGPASLPACMDSPRRRERSNSLSSLSNDSFGSTDKEVFERIVRMGMQPRTEKPRARSGDRLETRDRRRRRDRDPRGALDRMVGDDARDRALLEEVIARGAKREGRDKESGSKNVPEPSAGAAAAGELAPTARRDTGSDIAPPNPPRNISVLKNPQTTRTHLSPCEPKPLGLDSTDEGETSRSNECLAPASANTTIESERDELNRSNESYADVLDGSWSDGEQPYHADTLTRKNKLEWTDIKDIKEPKTREEVSRQDTWNDNTCPDDVTFPTISSSVHLEASLRSEALPDLLEQSDPTRRHSRPDLTSRLETDGMNSSRLTSPIKMITSADRFMLESVAEPSFASLVDDADQKLDSMVSAAIEREAARLAAQLKVSTYTMETSVTSLTSLDLDNVKPPSDLGSLLSLSASTHWEEPSQAHKKSRSRKKSLPVASMVKRALTNSAHHGSSEHLDSSPVSFLENVKPPSEMENIDMEGSMISVSSIVSEVAEIRDKTPVVFDFKQPIQDFPLYTTFTNVFHDLDQVNPPSLFDEMAESTLEIEQSTAQPTIAQNMAVFEDCISNTLNVVTDIPSGSENCTPLPSDISSVESTPKKQRDPKYLTPKEKRHVSKDRYQTYTITDTVTEDDIVLEVQEEFMTWTKSETEPSEYNTATSETKSKRKVSAKQRRLEDRARYQTQTVDIHNIPETSQAKPDPSIESLKQRLAAKKTLKQKRLEDAERFRTRTLSEDIPPSPTFVTRDANFENLETTTGYDSLSSNEPNHQTLDDRHDDVFSRDIDSGHNEDDFELNSTQMQTYTKSFRNYLPVIESPAAVDMCVVNNLKNIEMTASYRRTMQADKNHNPSSSDFASYEGDSNSEERAQSESDAETPRPKPKIVKPMRRDDSLDSNESLDKEQEAPKIIRGRKKAYVSPYRRSAPPLKKITAPVTKAMPKSAPSKGPSTSKAQTGAKTPNKTPVSSKSPSANTSPKKSIPNRFPTKLAQVKAIAIPPVATKPLPLERQGTFTKEESSVPAKDLPVTDKKLAPTFQRFAKPAPVAKANTSPSRLPQLNRYTRPTAKAPAKSPTKVAKKPEPTMRNSASNHSLQSNESGKTITIASRSSRHGSTSSIHSVQSTRTKDVESKIANLWKKVEQAKKSPAKADKRVWIESDKTEQPRLIRSSTFEGQPKETKVSTKQKTAIGIRVSQIPSLKPKSVSKPAQSTPSTSGKKCSTRVFARKPVNGQVTT
ncbi:Adenomatous polyposis coli protein [Operophtera brumata]|uniref:Adenomatous polyposis coli protein n=1 Tax=Operophtera brumata TaxID=104452 RepID=A0A0L7LIG7_OPEBR|nr:Adenomatous polyposis coli protein [Operophtera brumata]